MKNKDQEQVVKKIAVVPVVTVVMVEICENEKNMIAFCLNTMCHNDNFGKTVYQ